MCVIMMLIKGKEKERRRYISLKLYMCVIMMLIKEKEKERRRYIS